MKKVVMYGIRKPNFDIMENYIESPKDSEIDLFLIHNTHVCE